MPSFPSAKPAQIASAARSLMLRISANSRSSFTALSSSSSGLASTIIAWGSDLCSSRYASVGMNGTSMPIRPLSNPKRLIILAAC